MEKIRPFWRIVIGLFLFMMVVYSSNMMNMGIGNPLLFPFYGAALVTWIYVCIRVKYVDPVRAIYELELAKKTEADAERNAEEANRKSERDEWERTHGRMVFNIAGVTFKNDDGTKRQDLLKEVLASGADCDITFEEYEYNGKPAVRILYDRQHMLGNVPARMVGDFLKIMDKISAVNLDIQTFTPDDVDDDWEDGRKKNKEKLYRAEVHIVYDKAPD